MTEREALEAINRLRSNVIATQSASWSNMMYPLVAILNEAGLELIEEVSEEEKEEHLNCYGGAGGWPGNEKPCPTCGGGTASPQEIGGGRICSNTFHTRRTR